MDVRGLASKIAPTRPVTLRRRLSVTDWDANEPAASFT